VTQLALLLVIFLLLGISARQGVGGARETTA